VVHSKTPSVNKRTFIDVKHQKLVTCQHDCRYLALSYVWGGIPQLLLTKANLEKLFRDRALETFEGDIPQVIKDAMQFVSAIGENLLWVDSLCIVQDDELLKHDLISGMASVYGGAVATILAASGEHAAVGLPGVNENSRLLPHLVEIPGTGLYLTYRLPLNSIVDDSTYNTRGWTFQERLLSRRCLFFTDTQVFFECQKHLYSEDRFGPQTGIYPFASERFGSGNLIIKMLSNSGGSVVGDEEEQLQRYTKLVEEYCQKKFTYVNDILDAFAGISASMEQICGWKMVYGMPEHLLDHAILWEAAGEIPPHATKHIFDPAFFPYGKDKLSIPAKSRRLEVRNSDLPSWSWAAWIGGIRYDEWTASHLRVLHHPFQLGKSFPYLRAYS
jgi:Heterokaryon incompatibility protein (HET)